MWDNTSGFVLFFLTHAHFLWIFPCSNILSYSSFVWCIKLPSSSLAQWKTMPRCMISFALERWILHTFVAITCNNDVAWSLHWTPPSLTSLMIYYIMSPIGTNVFSMGMDELEGWLRFCFFSNIGGGIIQCHKPAHINNPWLFIMIFISLFIIKFIVINA